MDEAKIPTPEEFFQQEDKEEEEREAAEERKRVLDTRIRRADAVKRILDTLLDLTDCGDLEAVLDTVEAFYGYQPFDRLKAYLANAMEHSAAIMPIIMDIAERCFQIKALDDNAKKDDHAQRVRRTVVLPENLEEALRQIREAEAQAAASPAPDLKDMLRQAEERIRAKREISQEELDKVSKNLVQCEACGAAWPAGNGPCCPACGKPAY